MVRYKYGLQSVGRATRTLLRALNLVAPRTVTVLDTDAATAGSFFLKGIRAQGMLPKGMVEMPQCTVKHHVRYIEQGLMLG